MKHCFVLIFLFVGIFGYSQIHNQKITMSSSKELYQIHFTNKIISIYRNKSNITFSPDSQYCAIFTVYDEQELGGGYNIYTNTGILINPLSIPGEKIFISDDGRFAVYNPVLAENGLPIKSTMDFFDKSGNKVYVEGAFKKCVDASYLDDGSLFIIQNEENYSMRYFTKKAEIVLLDKAYKTVVRKNNIKYESIIFIPPKKDKIDNNLIIPIKTEKKQIINRKYDRRLNFISEKIQQ